MVDANHDVQNDEDLLLELDWSFLKNGYLYDRDRQIGAIHEAFRRCLSPDFPKELVLVSGKSGTGKSTLARLLENPVRAKGGYFVTGKFEQFRRPEPYSAFVAAFTEFASQIAARGDDTVAEIRDAIAKDTGIDVRLLIDIAPALEEILGIASRPVSMNGVEAQTRLKLTLRNFVRSICSRERPLVLLMDDLQWADTGSLDLLDVIISDDRNQGLVLVGVCRSDEVSFDSNFATLLRQLEDKRKTSITNIVINNLSEESTTDLISDVLIIPRESCVTLSRIVYSHTEGNTFAIVQLMQALYDDQILIPCPMQEQWLWDENAIRSYPYADDVVSLVARKIERLSDTTQMVLTTSACIGSDINEYLLSKILVDFDLKEAINIAALEGIVCQGSKIGCYAFSHDKMQQASYSLISNNERPLIHLSIGRRLLKNLSSEEIDEHIFVVVNQICRGILHVQDRDEKLSIASLCLTAGRKATLSSDFKLAATYFWYGVDMIQKDDWRDQYDLCLALYNAVAEAEYCAANFAQMEVAIAEVFANAQCFADKIRAYSTKVYSLGARMMLQEAIDLGLYVLGRLGEFFPSKLHVGNLLVEVVKVRRLLSGRTDSEILMVPDIEDETKIAAMRMMNLVMTYAFVARKQMFPYIVTRMVSLSMKYGMCAFSAFAVGAYGLLLVSLGNFEKGYRYGKLSLSILERYNHAGTEWIPRVYLSFYGMIAHCRHHVRPSLDYLMHGHRIAMETGDIEYGMISAHLFGINWFGAGMLLTDLEKHLNTFLEVAHEYKQEPWSMIFALQLQMIHNLSGRSSNPLVLTGEAMNQDEDLEVAIEKQYDLFLSQITLWRLMLAYHFGNLDLAVEMAEKSQSMFKRKSSYLVFLQCFYHGMSFLAAALKTKGIRRRRFVSIGFQSIRKMRKFAKSCPDNFMPMLLLMEAEYAALKGKKYVAMEKYDRSIDLAEAGNFAQLRALANERAAYSAMRFGQKCVVDEYLRISISQYREWGAIAKADKIENSPELASLVLEQRDLQKYETATLTASSHTDCF